MRGTRRSWPHGRNGRTGIEIAALMPVHSVRFGNENECEAEGVSVRSPAAVGVSSHTVLDGHVLHMCKPSDCTHVNTQILYQHHTLLPTHRAHEPRLLTRHRLS